MYRVQPQNNIVVLEHHQHASTRIETPADLQLIDQDCDRIQLIVLVVITAFHLDVRILTIK